MSFFKNSYRHLQKIKNNKKYFYCAFFVYFTWNFIMGKSEGLICYNLLWKRGSIPLCRGVYIQYCRGLAPHFHASVTNPDFSTFFSIKNKSQIFFSFFRGKKLEKNVKIVFHLREFVKICEFFFKSDYEY